MQPRVNATYYLHASFHPIIMMCSAVRDAHNLWDVFFFGAASNKDER